MPDQWDYTSYHRINTLNEMLACIAEGYPFVFGFTVYENFESQEVLRTETVHMPKIGISNRETSKGLKRR